jgi:Family of unknown function (DUF6325)
MGTIAPIQLIAVGFDPEARFEGRILAALDEIKERGSLRVLDLVFVRKDADGALTSLEDRDERFRGVLAAALGLEDANGAETAGPSLGVTEVEEIGQALEPGQAVGMVLVEHVWVAELLDAITATGGTPLATEFLSGESLAAIAAGIAVGEGEVAGPAG